MTTPIALLPEHAGPSRRVKAPRPVYHIGKLGRFRSRFQGELRGIVVTETIFPWCHGADEVTIYSPDSGCLHALDPLWFSTKPEDVADAQTVVRTVRDALQDYADRLAQYPAWRARIANGGRINFRA